MFWWLSVFDLVWLTLFSRLTLDKVLFSDCPCPSSTKLFPWNSRVNNSPSLRWDVIKTMKTIEVNNNSSLKYFRLESTLTKPLFCQWCEPGTVTRRLVLSLIICKQKRSSVCLCRVDSVQSYLIPVGVEQVCRLNGLREPLNHSCCCTWKHTLFGFVDYTKYNSSISFLKEAESVWFVSSCWPCTCIYSTTALTLLRCTRLSKKLIMLYFFEVIRRSRHLSFESALKYCFASWSVKKTHFLLVFVMTLKENKMFLHFIAPVA